jgi:hypothetical protein
LKSKSAHVQDGNHGGHFEIVPINVVTETAKNNTYKNEQRYNAEANLHAIMRPKINKAGSLESQILRKINVISAKRRKLFNL